MAQQTIRAIATDTLGRVVTIADSLSTTDQRLTALETQVGGLATSVGLLASAIESLNGTLATLDGNVTTLLSGQAQHQQIVAAVQTVAQLASDLQMATLQLSESVG